MSSERAAGCWRMERAHLLPGWGQAAAMGPGQGTALQSRRPSGSPAGNIRTRTRCSLAQAHRTHSLCIPTHRASDLLSALPQELTARAVRLMSTPKMIRSRAKSAGIYAGRLPRRTLGHEEGQCRRAPASRHHARHVVLRHIYDPQLWHRPVDAPPAQLTSTISAPNGDKTTMDATRSSDLLDRLVKKMRLVSVLPLTTSSTGVQLRDDTQWSRGITLLVWSPAGSWHTVAVSSATRRSHSCPMRPVWYLP
jgi:hypothetical protein